MSHVSSVARLKTLLPKYARCVFEVTHGERLETQRGGRVKGTADGGFVALTLFDLLLVV